MPHWKTEDLQQLLDEREPKQIFACAVDLIQKLDMEYLGLTLHLHACAKGPQVILYNNYPKSWNDRYQNENFISMDPTILKCHLGELPFVWNDDLFRDVPHLREEAHAHGMTYGWTQSTHDLRHNESHLSVSRRSRAIDDAEHYEKCAATMWLCNTLHSLLSEYHLTHLYGLSVRELEVMDWCAKGKIAEDIAKILRLSTSTVNFHIRSSIEKTDAANKTHAVAKLIESKQISPR